MPAPIKITKEKILKTAYEITKKHGIDAVSATAIAKKLSCSNQPIYYAFQNMDNLREAVIEKAMKKYSTFLRREVPGETRTIAAGLNFINFAEEYPNLFKLLFCSNRQKGVSLAQSNLDVNKPYILQLVRDDYGITEDQAAKAYLKVGIFCQGVAALILSDVAHISDEDIKREIREVFAMLLGGADRLSSPIIK